jgi:hypothetical protein
VTQIAFSSAACIGFSLPLDWLRTAERKHAARFESLRDEFESPRNE